MRRLAMAFGVIVFAGLATAHAFEKAYDVMLIERDGGASVFSSYAAGEKA